MLVLAANQAIEEGASCFFLPQQAANWAWPIPDALSPIADQQWPLLVAAFHFTNGSKFPTIWETVYESYAAVRAQ